VLSDGQFNRGEAPSIVGQFSRSKEIPVHTVAIGDPALPQNLTVQSVTAPSTVFVEDPFEITASLRAEGLIGTRAVVELIAIDDQQRDAVIDRKDISVDREGQLEPVRFEHQLEHPQPARLRVRIRSDQQETRDEDNAQTIRIDAIANKLRILLVAGSPTWEYRYLSRLLERDATVDLSCWLQSADPDAVRDGNTPLDHLPETLAELSPYDCFILLDPDPVALNMEWSSHVEKQITQLGAGLLYVAGRQYASRFARDLRTADLLSLLPVVIEPGESDLIINELGHFQVSDWPVEIPPAVVNHPVLKLSDDKSANVQIWNQLPGVYWHYPVSRSKPVATVFLRHSNPKMRNNAGGHVLLASQFVGSGRSGFLAYDQTWRWRRFGDRFYNRFWIQLIRHLVEGKLLSGQKRGLIQLEQDECTPGEAVMVEARLLNASHEAMDVPEVEAELLIDNRVERSVTLKATPNRPGWYRGQIIPTRIGTYDVRIQLPGQGDVEPATITAQLRVSQADLEMIRTQLNRKTLRTLAKSSAGGKMLEIDEADQLVSLIPRKTTTLVLSGEPVELWDRWWTLLALVALLGVEWALRKRYGLL
jgi:hypothetical protein